MGDFKYNPGSKIRYTLDDKPLTGVTTILGVIAKPALIQWSANETVKEIKKHFNYLAESDNTIKLLENLEPILEEARYAHRKKKEGAGDIGTEFHKEIENYINICIEQGRIIPTESSNPEIAKMVQNFVSWAGGNNVKFLASEKSVYQADDNKFYAGTLDFICEIDNNKYIGDLKTGSGIYPEHFYQMAAYKHALEYCEPELAEDIKGAVVVRIGKDGKFNSEKDVQFRYDLSPDLKAFLGALDIYRASKTYQTNNWKKGS